MKPYNKNNIPLARNLRKNMTPWELKLWCRFLRSYPIRFQRQKVIGNYIVDFYCAKAQLALELDGGRHYAEEQVLKDKMRTEELNKIGLKVIRISNFDIDRNFEGVCNFIDKEVKITLPQTGYACQLPQQREHERPSSDKEGIIRSMTEGEKKKDNSPSDKLCLPAPSTEGA